MMRKLAVLRGHQADVACAVWHPWHEDLLVSGSYDGSILHWLVSHPSEPQVPAAQAWPSSISSSTVVNHACFSIITQSWLAVFQRDTLEYTRCI